MKTVRRLVPMAAIGGALLLLATAVAAADGVLHPFLVAQPKQAPQEVNLAVEIPEEGKCMYTGSEALLKEVWVNLLDNAVKFSPEGGTVTLTLQQHPDAVTVTVTDQGPGMDEATQARIFDQFYQGDTSHKTEGNGLGLAMVKKIVTLHGGRVTVDSLPGQVSAFTVWLPAAKG